MVQTYSSFHIQNQNLLKLWVIKLDSLSSNVTVKREDAIGFDDYVLFDVYNHKK